MITIFAALATSAAWPVLVPWAWWQERNILRQGRPLSAGQLAFAKTLGMADPHRVRILALPRIPMPAPNWLVDCFRKIFPGFPTPAGMTLGHGIFVIPELLDCDALIHHELVHVLQHERCGGHGKFLWLYLQQCLTVGYDQAPLEVEARERGLG